MPLTSSPTVYFADLRVPAEVARRLLQKTQLLNSRIHWSAHHRSQIWGVTVTRIGRSFPIPPPFHYLWCSTACSKGRQWHSTTPPLQPTSCVGGANPLPHNRPAIPLAPRAPMEGYPLNSAHEQSTTPESQVIINTLSRHANTSILMFWAISCRSHIAPGPRSCPQK